jgi:hypothetical protein
LDDLIVGTYNSSLTGKPAAGKSYVVFGKANSRAINLRAIAVARNPLGCFVINGEAALDSSGQSVSSAGGVNGDGLDDLIVGAHAADPSGKSQAGKSYVVFGKSNTTVSFTKHNIRFTCMCFATWISVKRTHNQIIQAITVDITCARD